MASIYTSTGECYHLQYGDRSAIYRLADSLGNYVTELEYTRREDSISYHKLVWKLKLLDILEAMAVVGIIIIYFTVSLIVANFLFQIGCGCGSPDVFISAGIVSLIAGYIFCTILGFLICGFIILGLNDVERMFKHLEVGNNDKN